ncbi:MAG: hydrogenase maturation protein HypF, partial [Alphaproteobacteria bacterium]|nr:hydrogenase maturation protein HypF [Alphaproteobacteria bacterium]
MSGPAAELSLHRPLPRVLGMGAHLKASLCLIDGTAAAVTPPAGDMETLDAVERYDAMLADMLTHAGPLAACAHDLHPDFRTTQSAQALDCPAVAVQHHHAHIVATAWEHGVEGAVLGLALDGYGMGPGGASWGGELLRVDGPAYARLGHVAILRQPGGDVAAREPWRMAAAALHAMGRGDEIATR